MQQQQQQQQQFRRRRRRQPQQQQSPHHHRRHINIIGGEGLVIGFIFSIFLLQLTNGKSFASNFPQQSILVQFHRLLFSSTYNDYLSPPPFLQMPTLYGPFPCINVLPFSFQHCQSIDIHVKSMKNSTKQII